jgi:hypothetical protein
MRTRRASRGDIVIGGEYPTDVYAEQPFADVDEQTPVGDGRPVDLPEIPLLPADLELPSRRGFTLEDVAESLHCPNRTVLRMIKSGELHPLSDEDGDMYFDPADIPGIAVPISPSLSRLVPPRK